MSEQEEDFAALFAASEKARKFSRGQMVEGTIVAIGPKVAFIDIGGKGEAELDVAELKDDEGDITANVGDRITAKVVSTSGGITVSRKGVRNAATQRELEDAFQNGLAVEGKVIQEVKGGYEVRVAGERAFCPFSQMDIMRAANAAIYVGQVSPFRIIEYKNGGKDIVLSRRKLLEEQQRAEAEQVRKSIVPGAVLDGRVASVLDFGAFVELGGGIQGLVHVSEMSWTRVPSANAVVAPGDQLTVKVVRVDEATGKISLSMKQLIEQPAAPPTAHAPAAPDPIKAGEVISGKVERHERFGVFITVAPGRTGLMPLSESGVDRDSDIAKAFPIGSDVEVAVLEVDQAGRRIRLSKKAVIHRREQAELRDYESRQAASAPSSGGSLADKLREALGKK